MASPATTTPRVDWKIIWAQRGFRFFFLAMFVSLFGSGMNFVAVSWYILAATHSTVKVSLQVIVVNLPGLLVPFLGGESTASIAAISGCCWTWRAASPSWQPRTSHGTATCNSGISTP